ncbi:MAG: hypothetical protein KatS3mg106_366 [Gemmataceae bacterium]|jgi:hypothetical protein|nr:MAG: hypothetical protein KatS3mg106_366 [Gemmataceae bacterium]
MKTCPSLSRCQEQSEEKESRGRNIAIRAGISTGKRLGPRLDQFDFEDQGGIRRDIPFSLGTVAHLRGDD